MQFLNPIWLWGLTGLLIPIGIHLLSRKEGKVIRVGSIRHLEETSTRQFRNIRLNEFVLLALRCLLITLIVLLLSGMSFTNSKSGDTNWLVIERGMEKEKDSKTLVDSLEQKGFELRWLAKDFPLLKDSAATNASMNYGSLVESLKRGQAKQIVVLSYNYANRFKGKRTTLSDNIQWISKSPKPAEFTLTAIQLSSDSVLLRKGKTDFGGTRFARYEVRGETLNEEEKALLQNQDTISISVYSDAKFESDKEIIIAALKAVDQTLPCVLNIKTSDAAKWNNDKTDWIVWLSENEFPKTENTNGIAYSRNEFTNELLTLSDKGWLISKRLDQENAIADNLALQLASILLPKDKAQQRADKFDRRALPEKELWSSADVQGNESLTTASTNNAVQYLVVLILISLLIERILTFKRNQ
ncbi:MAG: BatA domain-containing protein [Chryseolinea sp.]